MFPGSGAAPFGAQCALHAGVTANFVCARCGNFMCGGCSINGTEKMCPTCRQLVPEGFPYDANADIGTIWEHTTSSFQRELVMCVIVVVLFIAFSMAGGIISQIITTITNAILGLGTDTSDPSKLFRNVKAIGAAFVIGQLVGTMVNMAVGGVALVGMYRVLMDVLVGKKADIGRMFSQLHLLPRYIGLHLIMLVAIWMPLAIFMGIITVGALASTGIDWTHLSEMRPEKLLSPALFGVFTLGLLVLLVASVVLLPVTMFSTPELIVGNCGPVEALKRSWELGSGQRLRTLGYSFVAGLVMIAGLIACGVGLLFAMPVAFMLQLSLFLAIRKSSPLPAAIH